MTRLNLWPQGGGGYRLQLITSLPHRGEMALIAVPSDDSSTLKFRATIENPPDPLLGFVGVLEAVIPKIPREARRIEVLMPDGSIEKLVW